MYDGRQPEAPSYPASAQGGQDPAEYGEKSALRRAQEDVSRERHGNGRAGELPKEVDDPGITAEVSRQPHGPSDDDGLPPCAAMQSDEQWG